MLSRRHKLSRSTASSVPLVAAYLNRLGAGSRRAMRQGLDRAAQAWLGNDDATADDVRWEQLTASQLARVRAKLADELAPASVNKILSAVRGVVREAQRQGVLDPGVASALVTVPWLPLDDADAAALRTLSRREVQRLFDACASNDTPAARRDAAALAVLLSCGLRRAELAALKTSCFQASESLLRIASENPEKTRVVRLHRPAAMALRDWLLVRGGTNGDLGGSGRSGVPLFPPVNKAGRVGDRRMTPQAVYDLVRRLGRRANVDGLTSRQLRRTCVVALIASGMPLEQVQQRLGHASWMTTAAYASLAAETAQAIDLNKLPYHRTVDSKDSGNAAPSDLFAAAARQPEPVKRRRRS